MAQMPRKSSSHQCLASPCSNRRGSGGLATCVMTDLPRCCGDQPWSDAEPVCPMCKVIRQSTIEKLGHRHRRLLRARREWATSLLHRQAYNDFSPPDMDCQTPQL